MLSVDWIGLVNIAAQVTPPFLDLDQIWMVWLWLVVHFDAMQAANGLDYVKVNHQPGHV